MSEIIFCLSLKEKVCSCIKYQYYFSTGNVRKWEKMVAEDEKELEKLKREEAKQMKVKLCLICGI